MSDQEKSRIIDASPTKDFFISMIIRDIELVDAVADLVDNCVDGARNIKPKENFKTLYVALDISPIEFRIEDNCGGISTDIARNYAFRFGRPKGFPSLQHSIGQFGIGMKRAFFKIGTKFTVESTSAVSHFSMTVDVNEWRRDDNWEFRFDELVEGQDFLKRRRDFDHAGTLISITELHPGVAAEFTLENFITRLEEKLSSKHQNSLNNGLQITVNHRPLKFSPPTLFKSKLLQPFSESFKLPGGVNVRMFAGVSESDPNKAGWCIFCNGRLILEADQSQKTGWGETKAADAAAPRQKKLRIPAYHNQFARFRGYVFFDADNAGALPWNTTKTDVDVNSPAFQATRQKMVLAMRPIIDFLNDLDAERAPEKKEKPLSKAVAAASSATLLKIKPSQPFISPKIAPIKEKGPPMQRIAYDKPKKEIDLVKKTLKARSLREIGERTFEYYLKTECTE